MKFNYLISYLFVHSVFIINPSFCGSSQSSIQEPAQAYKGNDIASNEVLEQQFLTWNSFDFLDVKRKAEKV